MGHIQRKISKILALTFCLFFLFSPAYAINAPTLSVSTSGLDVSLSWSSISGATDYKLYYAPYPFQGEETIGVAELGSTNSLSLTLWDGASFYVTVTADDGTIFGESGYSNVELFTTTAPSVSIWYQDYDGDGYGNPNLSLQAASQPNGFVANTSDCNDLDSSIYPGATEICADGVDQDCSGADEICGSASDNTGMYAYPYNISSVIKESGTPEGEIYSTITTTFDYDNGGNFIQKNMSSGYSTALWNYTYNGDGNIEAALSVDGSEVNFIYNSHGLPTQATDENGAVLATYTYDANNRLIASVTKLLSGTYNYDANENVELAQYTCMDHNECWTRTVELSYDGTERIAGVNISTDMDGDSVADEVGEIIYVYNDSGQVTSFTETFDYVNTPIIDFTSHHAVTYDDSGNMIQTVCDTDNGSDGSVERRETQTFNYTSAGMLRGSRLDSLETPISIHQIPIQIIGIWWGAEDGAFGPDL